MLMWETASECVLLENEKGKATVTKYIVSIAPFVLPKFYEPPAFF